MILISFSACDHYPLHRTFLIPSGFQGTLRIVYLEKCGVHPVEKDGSEIIEFQKNGLVILDADMDERTKNDFYLVDDHGTKKRVNQIENFKDRVNNLPAILDEDIVVTGMSITSFNGKTSTTSITCRDFALYNKDTTKIPDSKYSKELDSMTISKVNACRANK
jgi:hypothetical protein